MVKNALHICTDLIRKIFRKNFSAFLFQWNHFWSRVYFAFGAGMVVLDVIGWVTVLFWDGCDVFSVSICCGLSALNNSAGNSVTLDALGFDCNSLIWS